LPKIKTLSLLPKLSILDVKILLKKMRKRKRDKVSSKEETEV
jgi:hypothetical protein